MGRTERKEKRGEALAFLSPVRKALAWPGLFGWVGIVFALAGLWLVPTGLCLRSRAAELKEGGPRVREAAESARHLGFGETDPTLSVTEDGRMRWRSPFGFMVPSLRRERAEQGAEDGPPVYVLRDPLAGRPLVLAREGAEANARSSVAFGLFCLAVACFWWGFRALDPMIRQRRRAQAPDRPEGSGGPPGKAPGRRRDGPRSASL